MNSYLRPNWEPTITMPENWYIETLQKHLTEKKLFVFSHGTAVISFDSQTPDIKEAKERLLMVAKNSPDFKVKKHLDGNFLVTFKGGIGTVVSGNMINENISILKSEALTKGKLKSEFFAVEENTDYEDSELIAGLYARAKLHMDAESMEVIYCR